MFCLFLSGGLRQVLLYYITKGIKRSKKTTYRTEFIQSTEQLYDKVNGTTIDARVDNIQELGSLTNYVEGLHIIWLFSKVILYW